MTAEHALAWAHHSNLGLGFVFTSADPFFFLDIDECANPVGSVQPWQEHATQLVRRLPGAAVEISCSGRGLHIFGRCAPDLLHANRYAELRLELYTHSRFVAIGYGAVGDAGTDCTEGLRGIIDQYFAPAPIATSEWATESRPGTGISDNQALIQKALATTSAKSAFGSRASFRDLWEANDLALGNAFPDPHRAYDASRADAALASHLAFWTGGNCEQIQSLMMESALRRDKWTTRDDYLPRTILRAVSGAQSFYTGKEASPQPDPHPHDETPIEVTAEAVQEAEEIQSLPNVTPDQMYRMWKNFVYVRNLSRLLAPDGDLLKPEQFNSWFGHYVFPLDHHGGETTKDAHKAFIHGHCYRFPQAHELRFLPGNPQRMSQDGDRTLANSWSDPRPKRTPGDPSRFIAHVKKLLPAENDAEMLLAYLAACVQHQGQKFTWCPLLQGVQGNGKSTITKVLARAIGERYCHTMKGKELFVQFNGWLSRSVVVVVEDLKVGNNDLNFIKPLITEARQSIERKGIDQVTEHICANFILTTNHQDALPLEEDERRFGMFFCAQQRKEDLARHGLTKEYFRSLFDWLEEQQGYEIVAEYLWTCRIPDELNPAAHCKTAPETSSYAAALEASRSPEAQHILAAIEGGEIGFKNGWVSTTRVEAVLAEHRCSITPRRMRKVLTDLGYVWHPSLTKGQVYRAIPSEGGRRPRLYIKEGHLASYYPASKAIAAYEEAQGYPKAEVTESSDEVPKIP